MKTNTTYYAPPILTEMELAAENGFAASDAEVQSSEKIEAWGTGNENWL